ncbi:MAG: hypothetical protein KAG94_03865 [Clostridiales bacterium]|nr:hypothetical protein [Clostridiales bacterium]
MKKKLIIVITILVVLVVFFYPLRSYLVMGVYSTIHKKDSVFEKYDVPLQIKGGLATFKSDYYPFIMYFNDSEGFSRFSGIDSELSIIYNFGSFNFPYIASSLFNEKSPYYSTFYGVYAVKPKDQKQLFGFDNGKLIESQLVLVPEYDLTQLVLKGLGCENIEFSYEIMDSSKSVNDFVVVDAIITTNSMAHEYQGFIRNYLQYGRPYLWLQPKTSFKQATYYGKIYASVISESNITLCYYIITQNIETLEECEEIFLGEFSNK